MYKRHDTPGRVSLGTVEACSMCANCYHVAQRMFDLEVRNTVLALGQVCRVPRNHGAGCKRRSAEK